MRSFLRWLLRVTIALAILILAGIAWLFADQWMAQREWEQYRSEAVARGVKMTFAEYLQPEVPPEENYATGTTFDGATRYGSFKALDWVWNENLRPTY